MRPANFEDHLSDEQRELSMLNVHYLAISLRRIFQEPAAGWAIQPEKLCQLTARDVEDWVELLMNLKEALLYAEK